MRTLFGTLLAFWPWLTGILLYLALLPSGEERRGASAVGQGFFLGVLIIYLIMMGHRWITPDLSDASLLGAAFALLGLTALLGAVVIHRGGAGRHHPLPARIQASWRAIKAWAVEVHRLIGETPLFVPIIFLVLALRLLTQAIETWYLPVFPWDAWMNWAPKPRTWFELSSMVQFVDMGRWLAQGSGDNSYTIGAAHYPEMVPMLELWVALCFGQWYDGMINLPWVFCAAALGLAFFGQLREIGVKVIGAAVGCYLLLSTPYVNVHTTLAGYADLWLAAVFFLAVAGMARWRSSPRLGFLLLTILYCYMMTRLKVPGILLSGIVAFSLLWTFPWIRRLGLYPALIAATAILSGYAEIDWKITEQLSIKVTDHEIDLPVIGVRVLGEFRSPLDPIWANMGEFINWNIAWYLLAAGVLYCLFDGRCRRAALPWLTAFVATIAVMFLLFSTSEYNNAKDYTTLNRAFLYAYPIGICMLTLIAFGDGASRARESGFPPQGRAPTVRTP